MAGLLTEIELRKDELPAAPTTIYFGGGTPSLVPLGALENILRSLEQKVSFEKLKEVTLEANPEDVSNVQLSGWRKMGIDRLSIGTQSFFEEDLRFMNRDHTPEQAEGAVKRAQDAGYDNITIDLIYGIPNQSKIRWQENVGKALSLETQHLSSYCLTIEPRTALHYALETDQFAEKADDEVEAEYLYLHEALEANGFEHYEISNFARSGFRALHNGNYWSGKPYVGIGPSAHSFDGKLRRKWNVPNNAKYMQSLREQQLQSESEDLTLTERCNEIVMTSLRTVEGIALSQLKEQADADWMKSFSYNVSNLSLKMQGWLQKDDDRILMHPKQWLKCDAILRNIIV